MATGTVEDIVNRALSELGMPTVDFASGNFGEIGGQCVALLNSLCKYLWRSHDWQALQATATFTGDGVNDQFALPSDWGRQVNQTAWDQTSRRQVAGPVSSSEWGWLQYGITAIGIYYRYRILEDQFSVYPLPADGTVFKLAYVKSDWATEAGTSNRVNILVNGDDTPDFSEDLLVAGLKLRFWSIKGFDTAQLDQEYREILGMEKAQNQGARAILLGGLDDNFLINPIANIRDGNW